MRNFNLHLHAVNSARDCESRAAYGGVGVVIPVYNRRATLLETLPYVLAQTQPPTRLIVVDDGSTDDTASAAETWLTQAQPQFPWQVIRAIHYSAAHARAVGFERVSDLPVVAFLDSDDHWPRDFLQRGSAALGNAPLAVAASTDRRFVNSTGEQITEDDCRALASDPLAWFFHKGAGVASCSVLRTDAYATVGGWDPDCRCAEDAVLFCDMALERPWVHVPGEPVVFQVGSARARHEEHNLSRQDADSHRQWAVMFEKIFDRLCRRQPNLPRGELHRALAQRWYMAGKQLFAQGHADEARACFRRAVTWQPTMLRAWRRLATQQATRWAGTLATRRSSR